MGDDPEMRRAHRRDQPKLSVADVRVVHGRVCQAASDGRHLDRIRRELAKIDRSAQFSKSARSLFQDLLARFGVATTHPIQIPGNDLPFWQRLPNPLSNYQSTPQVPDRADVVIIGAGLTGAAAAYSLRHKAGQIVVLEKGDPCGEASGRNGGNFELLPENSIGNYEGLAPGRLAYMRKRYPSVPFEIIRAVSERQASLVLGLALRNRELLKETILSERIACDFSPRGWLHIAASEIEEQAICDEVSLAAQHGQRIEIWSRKKIRTEFGIEAPFLGRFIPGDGTYHPFKFVCGELQAALNAGVLLYARTKVRRIESKHDDHIVLTDRGSISARRVIVATNAFTRELFPELSDIEPYQSQILVTDHVRDRVRGRIVTSDIGPVFLNQPREGAADGRAPLLMGGGNDRPMKNPSSRRRSPVVHSLLMQIRDSFYPELVGQPPSGEWIGPMAFTPDGLPCIGFLRAGLVVAAGYNGYGLRYSCGPFSCANDLNRHGRGSCAGRNIFAKKASEERSAIPDRTRRVMARRLIVVPATEGRKPTDIRRACARCRNA
jgi:glycine/D-amino acid oxidase-like deaminating enzyme